MVGHTDEEEPMMLVAEAKQGAKPWRRMGLAVAAVGTIGAAVGVLARPAEITPFERASVMAKDFMRGFAQRKLSAIEGAFACDATFRWVDEQVEDAVEDLPGAMTAHAKLEQRETQHPHLQVRANFKAKEGMADDLKGAFDKLKEAGLEHMKRMNGPQFAHAMGHMLTIDTTEDGVQIIVKGPPPDEEMVKKFEEGLGEGTPSMSARIAVGRGLEDILGHLDESPFVMFNGLMVSVHTSVAKKLIAGVEEMAEGQGEMSHEMRDKLKYLEAISFSSEETTIKYRRDELNEYTQGEALREAPKIALPPFLADPLKGLKDYADGLTEVDVIGFPGKWGLNVAFTNFHLTPVLANMIGKPPSFMDQFQGGQDGHHHVRPVPEPEIKSARAARAARRSEDRED